MPSVSVIIPTFNEGIYLFLTVEALLHHGNDDMEIIIANDGSTDGSCDFLKQGDWPGVRRIDLQREGICAARNKGAREARGEVLLFMDAHCVPKRGWLPPLLQELAAHPESIVIPCISVLGDTAYKGYGLELNESGLEYTWRTWPEHPGPHPVPVACGCCLALRRETFFDLGAFDDMRTYGLEDLEISLRIWLFGGSVRLVPASEVAHRFKEGAQYEVPGRDFLYNRLRVATVHFEGERLTRILSSLQQEPDYKEAIAELLASDVGERRAFVHERRQHDADWFCERFPPKV